MIKRFIRKWYLIILGKQKEINIDKRAVVNSISNFEGNNHIGKYSEIGTNVTLGKYSYVMAFSRINAAYIGRFCSIGSNVVIAPWNHPTDMISTSGRVYRTILKDNVNWNEPAIPCEIGNDVWIGDGAILMGEGKSWNWCNNWSRSYSYA